MTKISELKKGCKRNLKVGQGNISPSGLRELGVGIRCGEIYEKDECHKRKEYIGKVIYCSTCQTLLVQAQEDKKLFEKLLDDFVIGWAAKYEEDITKNIEELKQKLNQELG